MTVVDINLDVGKNNEAEGANRHYKPTPARVANESKGRCRCLTTGHPAPLGLLFLVITSPYRVYPQYSSPNTSFITHSLRQDQHGAQMGHQEDRGRDTIVQDQNKYDIALHPFPEDG